MYREREREREIIGFQRSVNHDGYIRLKHLGALSQNLVIWLNSFNTKLSPKRYWQRQIPGGGGRGHLTLHHHHQNDPVLTLTAMRAILMFY